jgi:hypothetical protein
MKKEALLLLLVCIAFFTLAQPPRKNNLLQIIFTSDAHYGITRKEFRGDSNVNAVVVNEAMIEKMNSLPDTFFPVDGGVASGQRIGSIDYVIEGGDIANRMESQFQSAAVSWAEFEKDYINGIHLKNRNGDPADLLVIPGNHDISNAIGFYKSREPGIDPSSMVGIYNLMLHPVVLKTNATYNYKADKINYSKNINNIHFMFINLWPDSLERKWMENDLKKISPKMPVIIFAHDQPDCEAKHFTNPNLGHTINARDKFENLLVEQYKDSTSAERDGGKTTLEQKGWESFLKLHKNIVAYFHGNSNFNEFYDYHGIDGGISLPIFRVDSPMKGKYSKADESKLSFLVVSVDSELRKMTVRECLWNTDFKNSLSPVVWGAVRTISLSPKASGYNLKHN